MHEVHHWFIGKSFKIFILGSLGKKSQDPSVTSNKSIMPADDFKEGKVNVHEVKHKKFFWSHH